MTATDSGITRYYTKEEVAKILRVSLRTVERYMTDGMPYHKIYRTVRIPEDKLKKWLEERHLICDWE